jgi:PAS domain S-box-containing protein
MKTEEIETDQPFHHEIMVELNQALLLGAVRQHELTEAAMDLNAQLRAEITAREQTEEAFRASEVRYRTLFDLGPVAVYSCDPSGIIEKFNRRAAELWGREPALRDTNNRFCGSFKLFHPDGSRWPHEQCPMAEVVRGKIAEARDVEVVIERPDSSRVNVIVNIRSLRNARGELTGVINCFYDITERRRLEDALVERAAELARADRSKDEFLAMLAHELRNPLAPLRNAAEILKIAGASAEERRQAEGIVARQIENMARMVDDLLDVSRITEGKIDLRKRTVALETVLAAAVSVVRPSIQARDQEISVLLPAEPIFLEADPTRLDQVFGNLLANASKYNRPGGHISVRAGRTNDPETQSPEVTVRVRDDGIGIAADLLPRVFDLFVQATHALDRAHGGLGIGLTLVQRLVRMHGGSVEAHSAGLGLGSEFVVRLPILSVPPPEPPRAAPPVREAPRRILIVDDNEDSARSMGMLQRLRGHDTRVAFTGPAALAAATEFIPEVVLLDIGLPGMDGYEVARCLRAMPALAATFLVGLSGYGSEGDRARAQSAGFDEYMVKPADLELLREWLLSRVWN